MDGWMNGWAGRMDGWRLRDSIKERQRLRRRLQATSHPAISKNSKSGSQDLQKLQGERKIVGDGDDESAVYGMGDDDA